MTSNGATALKPTTVAAAGALFIFFWASGFVAAKYGFPYAEPFTFLAIRYAIGAALLLPITWIWKAVWPRSAMDYVHMVVAGTAVQSLYLVGVYYGIYLGVSTGVIALIVGLQPLLTGALAGPILGETVSRRQWFGLALGFVGLAAVVVDRAGVSGDVLYGLFFGLFGLISITLGTLYQKRFCAAYDVRTSVTVQNIFACGLMLVLAGLFETMAVEWTGQFLFALLWSAIGLSVIAIMLYYLLVARGAAAKVTSLIYLSPPTTAVMGYLAFGEVLSALVLGGMALAMVGVWLVNR